MDDGMTRDYRLADSGWHLARSLGMTTPQELIGFAEFVEQMQDDVRAGDVTIPGMEELAGRSFEEYLAGFADLVRIGFMRWLPDESAFAILIPGEVDAGVRVHIPVPTVEECNAVAA